MKKLLVLILALVMVFSLASCKTKCEKKGHLDEDANSVCDRCDASLVAQTPHSVHTDTDANGSCDGCGALFISYGDNKVVGTLLRKSLEKQFKDVKSLKIELDFSTEESEVIWYSYYDGELEEDVYYSYHTEDVIVHNVELLINKTDSGYSAKIVDNSVESYTYFFSDEDEVYTDTYEYTEIVYLIDGYRYTECDDELYIQEPLNTDLLAIIDKFANADLIADEERNELLDAIGAEVAAVLDIKEGKSSVSVDLLDRANSLIDYVTALDLETATLGDLINDALALVSEDLTAEDIVAELESYSALTVDEGFAKLDAWLTENHNTTFQGIYDSVVNNEDFVALFIEIAAASNEVDPEDEEFLGAMDELITTLRSFNMADFIAENEMGGETVYEFVNMWIDNRLVPMDELFTNVRALLATTVAELDEGDGRLSYIQYMLGTLTVNEINAKLDATFKNALEISELTASVNVSFTVTTPGEVDDKDDVREFSIKAGVRVYDISTSHVDISIEDDRTTVAGALLSGYFYGDGGYVYTSYGFDEDGEYYVGFDGEYFDAAHNTYISFASGEMPLATIFDDEIVISEMNIYWDGYEVITEPDAFIKITLDPDTYSVTFLEISDVQLPEYSWLALDTVLSNDGDPSCGYTFVGVERVSGDLNCAYIYFEESYPIRFVEFTAVENVDTNVILCRITAIGSRIGYDIYHPGFETSWLGGDYDEENINAYFGGDPTFLIQFDPDSGEFRIVEYPMIEDEYKANWPED